MAADYTRIHRLLKILTLIQAEPGWTAHRLAGECGVTVRTIYRDMRTLEAAGIPYFYDEANPGYSVRRDYFMPPVQLSLDESLALIALAEHIGGREQIPLTRPAARAITKVRSVLPVQLRQQLADVDRHINIQLAKAGPHEGIADVYEAVRQAIARKRALRCRYESLDRSRTKRDEVFRFDPYTLLFAERAWYAVGFHHGRGEVRKLKLNRFAMIEPNGGRYNVPADFALEDHLGNAWRMIRGSRSYNVEVWFDAEFAETVSETQWHQTQEIEWLDDESILFRCTVDGLDEIVWWVLSMGPHCVVRKPKALADRVKKLARQTADRYEGPKKSRRA